jgi:hypothetical protein
MMAISKPNKPIVVLAPNTQQVMLREGFLAAFFLPTPVDKVVAPLAAAFDAYLSMIPEDVLRWESIGANSEEWKPISKTAIKRCHAQLSLPAAKKRPMTSFDLLSGSEAGEAPEYGVTVIGDTDGDDLTLFQVYFPASAIGDADAIAARVRTLAELLPYESGYASPALLAGPAFENDAMREARPLAVRYPGYDVSVNRIARFDVHGLVRNAFWLNFFGPSLLKPLGGSKAFSAALPSSITSQTVGKGLMVRAGSSPEIGDSGKKLATPILRELGKIIKPVLKIDQGELVGVNFADDDTDAWFQKWLHRFAT